MSENISPPPDTKIDLPSEALQTEPLYRYQVPGGAHWSFRIRRGMALKLTDVAGNANAGMLFYNPEDPLERYNAPDTLKCQHTFKLTRGHCLYSDMGRVFCSIIADSFGWHDTVCGNLTTRRLREKYPSRDYQTARNDWQISGEQSFLVELGKYGLGRKDLAANLNLFSRVVTDREGNLRYAEPYSRPGDYVALRFEMDTLVALHTCPHPLHPADDYPKKPLLCEFFRAAPVAGDDYCMNARPENRRGFENNRLYHLGL